MRILILAALLAFVGCGHFQPDYHCDQYEWLGNPNCK